MRAILLITVFLLAGCQQTPRLDVTSVSCFNLQFLPTPQKQKVGKYLQENMPEGVSPSYYYSALMLACQMSPDATMAEAVTFAVQMSRIPAGPDTNAKAE